MAYSSIVNISFALFAIYQNTFQGLYSGVFYLLMYLMLTLSIFSIIFLFSKGKIFGTFYFIKDLRAIYLKSPLLSYMLIFTAFSYAGIPPLAGFFSKLAVLL